MNPKCFIQWTTKTFQHFLIAALLAGLALSARPPGDAQAVGESTDINAGLTGVSDSFVTWGDYAGEQPGTPALPASVSADWWATVRENVRRSEYYVTRLTETGWQNRTYLPDPSTGLRAGAYYQAPNRAHDLRTYFTPEGVRVIRRTETMPSWEWGLNLSSYGYARDVQPVAAAELAVSGNRIEYRRGNLIEWYVNDERGLEQGFTLVAPPVEAHHNAPLQLDLTLTGDLASHLTDDGQAIEFTAPGGVRILRYADLHAFDATGKALPAHVQLGGYDPNLQLVVDTTAAVYPITIDSTITGLSTTADWTAESDQASTWFGSSVGTAGDVNGDGYADVIVGASFYDNGQTDEGRAFVYHGSASGLSTTANWTAESNQESAWFGYSVGTAGDVNGDGYADVIVGAMWYDNGEANEGGAFVYHGSASGLSTTASWTAEGNQTDAQLGRSVGTAGDVNGDGYADVIVGADYYHDPGGPEVGNGRAYVYHGSASGLSASVNWTTESDQWGSRFGLSVGTAGDVNSDGYADVIVGALWYSNPYPSEHHEGRAFVYHGSASGLDASAAWTAEGNQAHAWFGASVGTAGDVNGDGYADVIVGASAGDIFQSVEGRAHVYCGSASSLSTSADWTAESDQADAQFGTSVGTAGDVNGDGYADVIVGAPWYDNGQTDEGRVFVYHGSASGLSTTAGWTAESDQTYAYFSRYSVGTAGDVNGDGYADVIVGAPFYDNGQTDEGRAFVYHGSAPPPPAYTALMKVLGDTANAHIGSNAITGDINGDEIPDLIFLDWIISIGVKGSILSEIYIIYGETNLPAEWDLATTPPDVTISLPTSEIWGWFPIASGDINGDGFDDVITGAVSALPGPNDTEGGKVYVIFGGSNLPPTISVSNPCPPTGFTVFGYPLSSGDDNRLGVSVASGDVNGDGIDDLLTVAPLYDGAGPGGHGRMYIIYGKTSFPSCPLSDYSADVILKGQMGEGLGYGGISSGGDINGDGFDDILVNGYAIYLIYGGPSLPPDMGSTPVGVSISGTDLSVDASATGDVNGDGFDDILLGAPSATDAGESYVIYGESSLPPIITLPTDADVVIRGAAAGDQSGSTVSSGNINEDSLDDILIGAPGADPGGLTGAGETYLIYGRSTLPGVCDLPGCADLVVPGEHADDQSAVRSSGDINADGYDEIIIGTPYANPNGLSDAGEVLVVSASQPGVALSGDTYETGPPGTTVTHTFTLTNSGNYTDTFALAYGGYQWPTVGPTDVGSLGAGMVDTFQVTVDIPVGTALISDTFIVTATSGFTTTVFDTAMGTTATHTPTILAVIPQTTTVAVGQTFDVAIEVQAGSQQVDGAAAYLDFEPSILQVASITPGDTLDLILQNEFRNNVGELDFAAGTLSDPKPTGTFILATVTFTATAESPSTPLVFNATVPRQSDVTFGGGSVLDHTEDGEVIVLISVLSGSVTLQGRPELPDPSWSVPLGFCLTIPGEAEPAYEFTPTTDQTGRFEVSDILPEAYEARVKNRHTLQNTEVITIIPGINTIYFGELREGDADDNNIVNIVDFSILATTFGKCEGDEGFDDRADFNEDGCVTILDFSLLASNFGQVGDDTYICRPQALQGSVLTGIGTGTGTVVLAIVPQTTTVAAGQTFDIAIEVQAGTQQVDGAAAYLNFGPSLQVASITPGDTLDLVLQNEFRNDVGENNGGELDFAAGTLSDPKPTGTFILATVTFTATAESPSTPLVFNATVPRQSDVTFGGGSVLDHTEDGEVMVSIPCIGDFDGDGDVDVDDIMQVASRWRTSCDNPDPDNKPETPNYKARYDLDGDCDIDIVDIMLVVAQWGDTCGTGP